MHTIVELLSRETLGIMSQVAGMIEYLVNWTSTGYTPDVIVTGSGAHSMFAHHSADEFKSALNTGVSAFKAWRTSLVRPPPRTGSSPVRGRTGKQPARCALRVSLLHAQQSTWSCAGQFRELPGVMRHLPCRLEIAAYVTRT